MPTARKLSPDKILGVLRAAGEETRFRILILLVEGDLNVTDLTQILGQSQPRISRHLKLLVDGGLVERVREGSWAFYRLSAGTAVAELLRDVVGWIDRENATAQRDLRRLDQVRKQRAERATAYFAEHAANWDRIRALHVEESTVEAAIAEIIGDRHFRSAVDLGTGTGRILEMIAPNIDEGIGIDLSPDMLSIARTTLDRDGFRHCRVRHGDIMNVPLEPECADLVVIHQVLHFLADPGRAINEAATLLKPGGMMVIVDFAPHLLEFLREDHEHHRLGFETDQIVRWFHSAGLVFNNTTALVPETEQDESRLTVSLWRAHDPRPSVPSGLTQEEAVA